MTSYALPLFYACGCCVTYSIIPWNMTSAVMCKSHQQEANRLGLTIATAKDRSAAIKKLHEIQNNQELVKE